MLTAGEIYYLNSALKGSPIFGIDPLKASAEESIRNITSRESLIQKKFLNEDGTLNELGFIMIKRLEDYKSADYYIMADGMAAAFKDEPYLVTLDMEDKKYKLERTVKAKIVAKILKDKLFLLGDKEVEDEHKVMNINRITKILELKTEDEVLFLKGEKGSEIDFYRVYFQDDENVFKYDVLKKTLYLVNPRDARKELLDLFKIKN